MDSRAQLALMAKAGSVFTGEDSVLSFPVTPVTFSPEQLDLAGDPGFGRLVEFSAIVNLVPDGVAWVPSGGFLWDAARRVLDAGFAARRPTAEEEAEYERVRAELYTPGAGGVLEPTPRLLAYRAHRDAYLVAVQEYRTASLSASDGATDAMSAADAVSAADAAGVSDAGEAGSGSSGPAVDAALLDVLRSRVADAERDWNQLGHRSAVEKAQARLDELDAASPAQVLARWTEQLNPDVGTLTRATDQLVVYPTPFAPGNATDEAAWRPFSLTGAEIDAAVASAPADLRERLGAGGDGSVTRIDFEFSVASLVRPWFDPAMFTSRFWRFGPGDARPISDGTLPGNGDVPMYPTAVVFARKVVVTAGGAGPAPAPSSLAFELLKDARLRHDLPMFTRGAALQKSLKRSALVSPSIIATIDAPAPTPPDQTFDAVATIRSAGLQTAKLSLSSRTRIRDLFPGHVFERLPSTAPAPEPAPPPAPPPAAPDTSVQLLAFVCRVVPPSPDPDPALDWSGVPVADVPGWFVVSPKEGLNGRAGPGTEFEKLHTKPQGTRLQAVSEVDGWIMTPDGVYYAKRFTTPG